MDIKSPQQRHANMSAIHCKNTKPELIVRKFLWSNGYRYRLNLKRLPGSPDIVLRKFRTCIFLKDHSISTNYNIIEGINYGISAEDSIIYK